MQRPLYLAHRAPLLGAAAAWGGGVVATHSWAEQGGVVAAIAAAAALAGLVLAWGVRGRVGWILLGLGLALAGAGALRTVEARARPADWDALGLPPREACLTVAIERVFASAWEGDRVGGLGRVVAAQGRAGDLVGQRVHFSTAWPRDAGIHPDRGVSFEALGVVKLLPACATDPDAFESYLIGKGVNFSFTRATVIGEPLAPVGAWVRFRRAAGERLERTLRTGLEQKEDAADLLVAMVLGQKHELTSERRERFLRSGTMHLFAISGLHIAGIATAVQGLLWLARVPAWGRFVAGTVMVALFVEITGAASSAVRAFWMVTAVLVARLWRLPGGALAALAATAFAVLVIEPHQLFSAGFQLSYGIVLALLFFGVPLQERWNERWKPGGDKPLADRTFRERMLEKLGRFALGTIALGVASALVGVPAGIVIFGIFSPAGFFVNLLLVPAAGLVMALAVGAMLSGLVGAWPVAAIFNQAAAILLASMEGVARIAVEVPGAWMPAGLTAPWAGGVWLVGMVAVLAIGYARGWRQREGGFWPGPAALLLGLVIFTRPV